MSLTLQAALWLRAEKNCPLVITERTPRYGHGQPDVLGITDHRYLLEIEIKQTVSDFRANANKHHMRNRAALGEQILHRFPKQYWFMVPPKLVDKVLPEVPDWAGLLTLREGEQYNGWHTNVKAVKSAAVNHKSAKLSVKECIKLMRALGNELFSLKITNHGMRVNGYGNCDPHLMDSFHSQKLEWSDSQQRHIYVHNPDYLNFQI